MDNIIYTDVMVIGSGLAGCSAAIAAAKEGAKVGIVSSLELFSGSSFFPGTWGFGLIGPKDESDIDNLCETIADVGMGRANKRLVRKLVTGIPEAIKRMEDYGIQFLRPNNHEQREFIPCFDHKTRSWYGIVQEDAKRAFSKQIDEHGIEIYAFTTIIDLIKKEDTIIGAIGICKDKIITIYFKACIIATGGMGGLFKHSLNTPDVCAIGQYLALKHGANLINMEFYQMMLGFLKPAYGTIFNEKVYRYSEFYDVHTKENIFNALTQEEQNTLLETRSMHGPFTSRLPSYRVDTWIYKKYLENEQGVVLKYKQSVKEDQPEFVKTYFDWLKEKKGISEDDTVHVGVFFHAANGGIEIDETCSTGIKGLFACGEVTGGMHGADRLGGLSTANGLVFGEIAGKTAATFATQRPYEVGEKPPLILIKDAKHYLKQIQDLNYRVLMVVREECALNEARRTLEWIESHTIQTVVEDTRDVDFQALHDTYQLLAAIKVSMHLVDVARARTKSKGSHYRIEENVHD